MEREHRTDERFNARAYADDGAPPAEPGTAALPSEEG